MHQNSLRVPFLASASFGALLLTTSAAAQAGSKPHATVAPGSGTPAANARPDDTALEGLPKSLKVVPGGPVELGIDARTLVDAACQVANPDKPDLAPKTAPKRLELDMKRTVSTLGRRRVEVPTFLLGQHPVTNAQWLAFVEFRKKKGDRVRPPYHWWRYGREDDYTQRLPEITKAFPGKKDGPLLYWEQNGHELPYALKDAKGASIADQPVTYISWREANEFAGWLGMRLPTEAEFTRAARGDGKHTWPLAKDPATDRFTEQLLKDLQIFSSREKVAKPVGAVPAATGPFGHMDMFGQVWQLTGELGYHPINGSEPFAAEWKLLQKDKTGQLLQAAPDWKDDRAIAKGGSWLSSGEPIQLLIDARAPVQDIDVLESMGCRLAKSMKPGYDAMYSSLRGVFSKAALEPDQDVDLTAQIGAERYKLGDSGHPTEYDVVTFAPLNFLSRDKSADLGKLEEGSLVRPFAIGALMVTEPLLIPAAPAGLYTVLWRKHGMPRELVDAIKQGHREITAMSKSKPAADKDKKAEGDGKEPKEEPKEEKPKEEKKEKRSTWRDVIARHGITEKDVESKDAADGNLKFIRIDGVQVPTDRDAFLLHDNDGKIVAAWPGPNARPAAGPAFPAAMALEGNDKGKAIVKFHVAVPLSQQGANKRVVGFHFHLVLDREAPTADTPWRLPTATK